MIGKGYYYLIETTLIFGLVLAGCIPRNTKLGNGVQIGTGEQIDTGSEDLSAEVLNSTVLPDDDNGYFVALVKNTGSAVAEITLKVSFFDTEGNILADYEEDTFYRSVLPNEVTPVMFPVYSNVSGWASYEVSFRLLRFYPNPDNEPEKDIYRDFRIVNTKLSDDPEGYWDYLLEGDIINSGTVPVACPVVTAVVFGENNVIIGVTGYLASNPPILIDKWDVSILLTPGSTWMPFMPGETSQFSIPIRILRSTQPEDFLIFPFWNDGGCPWPG